MNKLFELERKNKMGKELTLEEAENIIDNMYQNKFIDSGTVEGNNIHLGNMDNIEFIDLEKASIYLLREEMRLKRELQRKDNNWNELKKWCNECLEDHRIAREEGQTTISDTFFEMILDKINELEEDKI